MKTKPLLSLLSLVLLIGCTTRYEFRVDAIKAPQSSIPKNSTIFIEPLDPETPAKDLRFLELQNYLARAMAQNGYRVTPDKSKADYILLASAHLSEPIHIQRQRMDPVYYQSYGRSRLIARPVVNDSGQIVRYEYSRIYLPPEREFAGYVNRSESVTVFDKLLRLSLRETQSSESNEIWNLNVYNRSTSQDLRQFIPWLITAGMPYFGNQTDGEIEIVLDEKNPDYTALNPRKD